MPTPETEALFTKFAALDPDAQQDLVETGEQFGTTDVLRQLTRFASAQAETGDIPTRHGFSAKDKSELTKLDASIVELSGVRLDRGVERLTSTDDYRDTLSGAKAAARGARTVLENTDAELGLTPGPESKVARATIAATLNKISKVGRSKTKLVEQLTLLSGALSDAGVAAASADRGGAEALTEVTAAIAALTSKAAPGSKVRGTPADTRRLNLLEGYAVNLLRRARAAARAWSNAQRNPTLAKVYELEFLYGTAPATPSQPPRREGGEP